MNHRASWCERGGGDFLADNVGIVADNDTKATIRARIYTLNRDIERLVNTCGYGGEGWRSLW